ncbi:MAG: hypothetical protein A3G20_04465 [Acidobacteria bacterium RIFCSPLOWO2_12_FULL_59_11]|nr:MAG: hypothetical protein A3G20_04465 [Acidobacteria bacterium RIFCSPLOWO2_12_FULL_59_11]OFW20933.1 MAG: hypothetical protein A3H27_16595 [Acidobacteria bacterium RIFCSPLOWO2_02_FULL_59_13]
MKGYIYTMFAGADPGVGWHMTDPIFGKTPTLGACMPNVRRYVSVGDYVFVVSGRAAGVNQYVVGGFKVAEKIHALAAYNRFPQNRLVRLPNGELSGNVIVDTTGRHHILDYHDAFQRRLENYIVGRDPVQLKKPEEVMLGREKSLPILQRLFDVRHANRIADVIGRMRKLDEKQIERLLDQLRRIKEAAHG